MSGLFKKTLMISVKEGYDKQIMRFKPVKGQFHHLIIPAVACLITILFFCPAAADRETHEQHWIIIDPVGNHTIGDQVVVSGTTDMPAGTNMSVIIWCEICCRQRRSNTCFYDLAFTRAEPDTSDPDIRVFSAEMNTSGFRGRSAYEADVSDSAGYVGNRSAFFYLIDPTQTEPAELDHQVRVICSYIGPNGTKFRDCSETPTESQPVKTRSSPKTFLTITGIGIIIFIIGIRKRG